MRSRLSSVFKVAAAGATMIHSACGGSTSDPANPDDGSARVAGHMAPEGGSHQRHGGGGALGGGGGERSVGVSSGGAAGLGGREGGDVSPTGSPIGGAAAGGRTGIGGAPAATGASFGVDASSGGGGSKGPGGTTERGGSASSDAMAGLGGAVDRDGAPAVGGAQDGSTNTVRFPAKFVGNTDAGRAMRSDFPKYWDQVTPETAGEWESVQASEGAFQWSALDALYRFAEDNNLIFKEHAFVWGGSKAAWVGRLTPDNGPAAVQKWMSTFCARYPRTRLIDVVYEPPPHTTPIFADAIGGGSKTTWDWVINSFRWAREACPDAVLLLNDYDNLENEDGIQNTIDLVTVIKKAGAPIDAIGCAANGASKLPASTLQAAIDRLASETGLPIYVTEYEVDLQDDEKQKQQYEEHFPMFWNDPSVRGVTVWGYVLGSTLHTHSGIMSSDGTQRPAMSWLMDFLGR